MKNYSQLSQNERDLIASYLASGLSHRYIAKLLNRNHRTVSREIQRNSSDQLINNQHNISYLPSIANKQANYRKHESKTSNLDNPAVRNYVIDKLQHHWSPEQISGRLKTFIPNKFVSTETIYTFIYDKKYKHLNLFEYLRKAHSKRTPIYNRKPHQPKRLVIPNKTSVKNRPSSANNRKSLGHYESDLMEGLKISKHTVSVTSDRKSRIVYMDKLSSKESVERIDKLSNRLKGKILESVTFDNGSENFYHERLRRRYGINTYFCEAYHSWEKGTVENTIGLIRQYIPKKTNLSIVSQEDLDMIAFELNTRPRKVLNYRTPIEVLNNFDQVGHFR